MNFTNMMTKEVKDKTRENYKGICEVAFSYHFSLLEKCLNGERQQLTPKSREQAIKVERFELLNECQEWKPWKKGKETDTVKVAAEMADVILFEFDRFSTEPIHEIKKLNYKFLTEIERHEVSDTDINQFLRCDRIDYNYSVELIAILMHTYNINMDDLMVAIMNKVENNMVREDHI